MVDDSKKKQRRRSLSRVLSHICTCIIGLVFLLSSLWLLCLSILVKKLKGRSFQCCLVLCLSIGIVLEIYTSFSSSSHAHPLKIPGLYLQSKLHQHHHPRQEGHSSSTNENGENNKELMVHCQGWNHNMTFSRWISSKSYTTSRALCDPTIYSAPSAARATTTKSTAEPNLDKPVKVFIWMGQSNMLKTMTTDLIRGDKGSDITYRQSLLEDTIQSKKRFVHLYNSTSGGWSAYQNVRHVAFDSNGVLNQNEFLGEYKEQPASVRTRKGRPKQQKDDWGTIGPELQFGYVLSQIMGDSPILLLKSCAENRSLGWDWLPPGSKQYQHDGYVYAGSGESPERWKIHQPTNTKTKSQQSWHAGKQYEIDVANARHVLNNIQDYYPGLKHKRYEIEGFVWWQGTQDLDFPGWVHRYERNLVNLIVRLRRDFQVPRAKVAIATIGGLQNTTKAASAVFQAQMAVGGGGGGSGERGGKYPAFLGNVHTVDIRSSWEESSKDIVPKKNNNPVEYFQRHAETCLETGNALGWAMAKLLYQNQQN